MINGGVVIQLILQILTWLGKFFKSPSRVQVIELANETNQLSRELNELAKDMSSQLKEERLDKKELWKELSGRTQQIVALEARADECERREALLQQRLEKLEQRCSDKPQQIDPK